MKKQIFAFITLLCLMTLSARSQQWGLYTLYAPINNSSVYLIDTSGTTYKTWTFSSTAKSGFSHYLLHGDTLLRAIARSGNSLSGGGMTGEVQKTLWDGTVVWDFVYSSTTYCLHHDIHPMPNGNVLMTCYEVKSGTEATTAGCSQNITIWSEKLIEVQPTGATTGNIVWEWKLWDHICQNTSSTKPHYVTDFTTNPQWLNINYNTAKDWVHMNGLDYNETLDQITFSSRTMNEIYVIDHSTTTAEAAGHTGGNSGKGGDFLYRWGNPNAYGVTGTTVFNVVHDAHWISSDNPNYPNYLCGFNNGGGTGGKSCVDIIVPPYSGYTYTYTPGSAMPPTTYAYRHTSTTNTFSNGSSQQLPNGNMLVCLSNSGYLYEINSAGTSIWNKTVSGSPASAIRYDKCHVRGPHATLTASSVNISSGQTITLTAAGISPSETSPTYSYAWSSSPAGFSSSLSNPTDAPTVTTTYTVTVTNTALGCSDEASVTVTVGPVGISEDALSASLTLFPNPTNGTIEIKSDYLNNRDFTILVYDIYGHQILQQKNLLSIDLSACSNGMYYVSVQTANARPIMKKIELLK
ncbi:MAG: aryl-sulfate sulfotransferase [Bacteroidota bacterium]